jgi:tetratricopeptide (TPR) repeat protein
MSKVKLPNTKSQDVPPPGAPPPPSSHVAPLFRKVDWLTLAITTLVVFVGYYLTLAPDLTLEDSGELAVGSMYAGIPHPPGYPVWTIYTWFFTKILPFSNIAWRVGVASAFAGALSCGLLGMLVSRGSSMMIEGIAELKDFNRRWENAICVVSGFVAGTLLGFNGFMWSQSVIAEVYSLSVLSLMAVMLFLLRWTYAPHQYRYLCLAFFMHGICTNNHQSLLVIVLAMEALVVAVDPRMAKELFFWNVVCYLVGLMLGPSVLTSNVPVFVIFNVVGLASTGVLTWMCYKLKRPTSGVITLIAVVIGVLHNLSIFIQTLKPNLTQLQLDEIKSHQAIGVTIALVVVVLLRCYDAYHAMFVDTRGRSREWKMALGCGGSWILGALFYLYMPIAGMSNPPMQWGYPRTVEGFFHALTRGQYEKIRPTSGSGEGFIQVTSSFISTFTKQMSMYFEGMYEEFNFVYLFIAVLVFFFYRKMQPRERAWLLGGVIAMFVCLGPFLVLLLNPGLDRQSLSLNRVFFTASHGIVAMAMGYGLALIAAFMATQYSRFRSICLIGGGFAAMLALLSLVLQTRGVFGAFSFEALKTAFNEGQYALPVFAALILLGMTLVFVIALFAWRARAPLALSLALFTAFPLYSVLSHWADNEQRGHMFGYWFGHDMFTPPFGIYPEMTKDAILYGGTDPGRFCPTYMVFAESFTPPEDKKNTDPKFDRRDVYIITQNALADGTYLNYIRAHYHRSAQKLRGLDTPFFQELFRPSKERTENWETNFLARLVSPLDRLFTGIGESIEKDRRVGESYFQPEHFKDVKSLVSKLRAQTNAVTQKISGALSSETRALLSGGNEENIREALAEDLNQLLEKGLYDDKPLTNIWTERWKLVFAQESILAEKRKIVQGNLGPAALRQVEGYEAQANQRLRQIDAELDAATEQVKKQLEESGVPVSDYLNGFIRQAPTFTRPRLVRLLLEAAFPAEITPSPGGVYPDREMYIASPMDSQKCFDDYLVDAQRRAQAGQLKPGEDVRIQDGKVQVSGQVAVMSINGLLTKVMFDANPDNEFFVEESFPLDWMYPHLTPFGIIMKINRQPLPALSAEVTQKDHEFWRKFSDRLIGDWIDYDTPVSNIVQFIEKVYLRHDWSGLTPEQRKFVRDDQGQKAFSKLRSSIGGIYSWRLSPQAPAPYRVDQNHPDYQRIFREADFTFKQAFAYCPYSPEAVFRYVNLLIQSQPPRLDDAMLVAETCLKLDPFSGAAETLVKQLQGMKGSLTQWNEANRKLQQLEQELRTNPSNYTAAFELASIYMGSQQPANAERVLDGVLDVPGVNQGVAMSVFRAYYDMKRWDKVETTLEKMTNIMPNEPVVWFDLAGMKASSGKNEESLRLLAQALSLNTARRAVNPQEQDLTSQARTDTRFNALRQTPEFQKLISPQ